MENKGSQRGKERERLTDCLIHHQRSCGSLMSWWRWTANTIQIDLASVCWRGLKVVATERCRGMKTVKTIEDDCK